MESFFHGVTIIKYSPQKIQKMQSLPKKFTFLVDIAFNKSVRILIWIL